MLALSMLFCNPYICFCMVGCDFRFSYYQNSYCNCNILSQLCHSYCQVLLIVDFFRWVLATSNFPSVWRVLFSPIPRQPHNPSYFIQLLFALPELKFTKYGTVVFGLLSNASKDYRNYFCKAKKKSRQLLFEKYFL